MRYDNSSGNQDIPWHVVHGGMNSLGKGFGRPTIGPRSLIRSVKNPNASCSVTPVSISPLTSLEIKSNFVVNRHQFPIMCY